MRNVIVNRKTKYLSIHICGMHKNVHAIRQDLMQICMGFYFPYITYFKTDICQLTISDRISCYISILFYAEWALVILIFSLWNFDCLDRKNVL